MQTEDIALIGQNNMEKDVTYLIQELRKETSKEGNKLLDELIDVLLIYTRSIDEALRPKND